MKSMHIVLAGAVLCCGYAQTLLPEKQSVKASKLVDKDALWTVAITDKQDNTLSSAVFRKNSTFFPGRGKGLHFDFGPFGTDENKIYVSEREYAGSGLVPVRFFLDARIPENHIKSVTASMALPSSEIVIGGDDAFITITSPQKTLLTTPAAIIIAKGKDMQGDFSIKMDFSKESSMTPESEYPTVIQKVMGSSPIKLKLQDPKIVGRDFISLSVYKNKTYAGIPVAQWKLEITDASKNQSIEIFGNGSRLRFNGVEQNPAAIYYADIKKQTEETREREAKIAQRREAEKERPAREEEAQRLKKVQEGLIRQEESVKKAVEEEASGRAELALKEKEKARRFNITKKQLIEAMGALGRAKAKDLTTLTAADRQEAKDLLIQSYIEQGKDSSHIREGKATQEEFIEALRLLIEVREREVERLKLGLKRIEQADVSSF